MKWIIGILIFLAFSAYGILYISYCVKQKRRTAVAGMFLSMAAALFMLITYLQV